MFSGRGVMSKNGRHLFRKRRKSVTFHVDENFGEAWRKRNASRPLGLTRALMTGVTLCFSLGAVFTALHYIPAQVSPSQLLRVSDMDRTMLSDNAEGVMAWVAPYWDSLQTRRTFIRGGEAVEVRFQLDRGQVLDLVVERCARQIVREVFDCQVESQQVVRVDGTRGLHRFQFKTSGFYRFREIQDTQSRVVWRRV